MDCVKFDAHVDEELVWMKDGGDGNLLFHLFNLIQHSLLSSLWVIRAFQQGVKQIYHTTKAKTKAQARAKAKSYSKNKAKGNMIFFDIVSVRFLY